jgi:hypothetical protein
MGAPARPAVRSPSALQYEGCSAVLNRSLDVPGRRWCQADRSCASHIRTGSEQPTEIAGRRTWNLAQSAGGDVSSGRLARELLFDAGWRTLAHADTSGSADPLCI